MRRFIFSFIPALSIMAGIVFAFSSCNNNDDDKSGKNPALARTFYVAGSENSGGTAQPVVWVNGTAKNQGNDGFGGICNAVAIGGDNSLYAGVVSNDANSYVYKNGERLLTLEKSGSMCGLNSMALLGDVVYSCGYDETAPMQPSACVWKGSEKYFTAQESSNGVKVLPVNENEIYMVANEYSSGKSKPAIYKNGSKLYTLPSADGIDTYAKDAFYINGDIYTVGEFSEYPPVNTVIVWKNNIEQYRITGADGANCNAGAIYVNRLGNIFVGGQETNEDGELIAKIWKDGNTYYELDGGADRSNVTSITEYDGLIYSTGETHDWGGAHAIIWQENAILYKMLPTGDDPVTKQLVIK